MLPEMVPGGNVGQLTVHRPRWTGSHESVQSPPDTMHKSKAQADPEAREGAGAAGTGLAESKNKGGRRGSASLAPNLVKDLVSESASGSVSEPLTDIITTAHIEPACAEVQAVKTADEPPAGQACKPSVDASANRETARLGKESAGEQRSKVETLLSQFTTNRKKCNTVSPNHTEDTYCTSGVLVPDHVPMFHDFIK